MVCLHPSRGSFSVQCVVLSIFHAFHLASLKCCFAVYKLVFLLRNKLLVDAVLLKFQYISCISSV